MAVIGSLSVKLGLVTVDWDKATSKAKTQAKELQRSFQDLTGNFKTLADQFKNIGGTLGLGIAGFGALAAATVSMADDVKDLASAYDLTIGKVLQFKDALAISGGKAENASKILGTLFDKVESAKDGNEAVIKQFQDLGISFDDLNKLQPDQMLTKVFDGLSDIGSTYERIAKVKDMLGKGGLGLSLQEMKDALNQSTDATKGQEESIKRLAQFSDNLKQTMTNLKLAFADILSVFTPDAVINVETFKNIFAALVAYKTISGLMQFLNILRQIKEVQKDIAITTTILQAMGGVAGLARIGAALAAGGAVYALMKNLNDESERAVGLYQKVELPKQAPAYAAGAGASATYGQQIVDTGLNFAMKEGEGVHIADKEQDTKNRPELQALDAKIKLSRQLLELEKQSNQNKLDELTTDKMITDLKQVGIKLSTDLVNIQSQYEQQVAASKDKTPEVLGRLEQQKFADEAKAREEAKGASQLIIANAAKENKLAKIKLNYQQQLNGFAAEEALLNENSYQFSNQELAVIKEQMQYKKTIADLDNQIAEARQNLVGQAQTDEIARLESIKQSEDKVHKIRLQGIANENERQQSFTFGWKQAFDAYIEDAKNASQVGGDVFNSVVGNMGSALDNFVQTGKFSFKDFANSIIQDILRIMLRWQMMQIVMGVMGSFGKGGMGGTNLGTDLPGLGDVAVKTGLPLHASGGYADRPSIVGENGAELFIPNRPGTIIPNARMGDFMGSQPQTVINGTYIANMSAIDTQSAQQFLAKNRTAVFAANQSAMRGLPAGR